MSVKVGKVTRKAVALTLTSRETFAFTGTATLLSSAKKPKALSGAARFSLGKPAKVSLRLKQALKAGRKTKLTLRLQLVAAGGVKRTVDVKVTVRAKR